MSKRDYYDVLGLSRTATDQEIKSAYRKLALKFHPDRNPGDHTAEERFKEAAEAYAVLADPQKRTMYDRFGHAGVASGAGGGPTIDPTIFADFGDLFAGLGDVFGLGDLFGGGGRRRGVRRGADLRYDLEITFEEAARGTETSIQIPREELCEACRGSGAAPGAAPEVCPQCRGQGQLRYQQGFFTVARTCGHCRGSGRIITRVCPSCRGAGHVAHDRKLTVRIPAGIDHGQRLRLVGEGEHGSAGAPPGDLYVVVHVEEHPFFKRDAEHLHCEVAVPYPTLVLGGHARIPTLDEPEELEIPAGTEANTVFRIRGKGLPAVTGRGKGDLYVRVGVAVPRKLTREQRQAIEDLARVWPNPPIEPRARAEQEQDKPFFERVKDIFG
ncbi:MAG: molecular chaperone DnaJ [Luteitalea sp.]|nr:molecular chaperone DnaJ [Luteitalea sp.]